MISVLTDRLSVPF